MSYNQKGFEKLKHGFSYSIGFVALLWVIAVIDLLLPMDLTTLGVYPRSILGLIGIPLSVFLHSGFSHLASNSLPLIFLMATLIIVYPKPAFPAMLFMVLYANILVLYGELVWGVIPGLVGWYISWESHLFGAIVGVYLAHFYKKDL